MAVSERIGRLQEESKPVTGSVSLGADDNDERRRRPEIGTKRVPDWLLPDPPSDPSEPLPTPPSPPLRECIQKS